MKSLHYFLLFIVAIPIVLAVALFQKSPGYMDADYYYAIGLRLNRGDGFSEPFLWNYLDNPNGIPHPSNTYWMPLPSILAFLGMYLTGIEGYFAARLGFLLLAGLIPVITCALSYTITRQRDQALYAGILACIPAFYLPYLGTIDSFSITIVLGGLWFLVVANNSQLGTKQLGFCLGLISGFIHLTRADGVIWLLLAFLVIVRVNAIYEVQSGRAVSWMDKFVALTLCFIGYALVIAPWIARNVSVMGTLFSPGGVKTLWLTDYDELYSFPASLLNYGHWWQSGILEIMKVRLYALGQNLQTFLAVQGEIFLLPLILAGLWCYRKNLAVQMGLLGWLLTLLVMTFVFPFVGWRGGFFHSGAILQSLFLAMVPVGLAMFIQWGVRVRKWNARQAGSVFKGATVCIALMLTIIIVSRRVIGSDLVNPIWGKDQVQYQQLENALRSMEVKDSDIFLVNNSPGFYVATGRQALSVPNGDVATLLQAARKYGGDYLLLEPNHPAALGDLYAQPGDRPGLRYLNKIGDTQVYLIEK